MQRLRVGVIGLGGIAQIMHLPHLRTLPEMYELAAICDISPGLVKAIGDEYNVTQRYTDFRELCRSDVDAVLILTPGSHAPAAIAAMEAGKDVFVEKPLCFTLREADEIIAAQKRTNRTLMVGYHKRYDPAYAYVHDYVHSLQDIRYIQVNVLHPNEDLYRLLMYVKSFRDIPAATLTQLQQEADTLTTEAIGQMPSLYIQNYQMVVLGSLVHNINALRGLFGNPTEIVTSDFLVDSPRDASITTILHYGERTRVVLSWVYLTSVRDYFEELAVMAPSGRLRMQYASPYLRNVPTTVITQGMEGDRFFEKRTIVGYESPYRAELQAFHDCVTNRKEPVTSAEDARQDIAILQKIMASYPPFQKMGIGGEAVR